MIPEEYDHGILIRLREVIDQTLQGGIRLFYQGQIHGQCFGVNTARTGNIILCEGYMDVIAMHQAGFTQAVASLGTATPVEVSIKNYETDVDKTLIEQAGREGKELES